MLKLTLFGRTILWLAIAFLLTPGKIGAQLTQASMVTDRTPGTSSALDSQPYGFCQVGSVTYFGANGVSGIELWRTDGTSPGTYMVKDINPTRGSSPRDLINFNGTLFFTASTDIGRELWKSDGTAAGTVLVKDIYSGEIGSIATDESFFGQRFENLARMTIYNGSLYFIASDSGPRLDPPYYLYKTDGTAEGTVRMGADAEPIEVLQVSELAVSGNLLFFTSLGKLWKTDGTEAGTVNIPVPGNLPGAANLTDVNGSLFFSLRQDNGFVASEPGRELFKSDGTAAGTVMVKDIEVGVKGAYMSNFISFNGKLVFSAGRSDLGPEPWISDGTDAGTTLLVNINPNVVTNGEGLGSFPKNFAVLGNQLWFAADHRLINTDPNNDDETRIIGDPWVTDGTPAGTRRVVDIENSSNYADAEQFQLFDGQTYFIAEQRIFVGASARRDITVFKSNGTEAGTAKLSPNFFYDGQNMKEIFAGPNFLFLSGDKYINNTIPQSGRPEDSELWRSDGTDPGTVLVKQIGVVPLSSDPLTGIDFQGKYYFSDLSSVSFANDHSVSDGTAAGTQYFNPANVPSAQLLGKANNLLFFSTPNDEVNSDIRTLFSTNGTEGGSVNLKESESSYIFVPWGDRALFLSESEITGWKELWVTNGTQAGTTLLLTREDIEFSEFCVFNSSLVLFTARTDDLGQEIWRTDGTAAGTSNVKDLIAGRDAGGILGLTVVGDRMVFFTTKTIPGATVGGGGYYSIGESDGTAVGTNVLIPAAFTDNTGTSARFTLKPLGVIGQKVLFTFETTFSSTPIGYELWSYERSASSVELVKDINPGVPSSFSSNENPTIVHQGLLYFQANDGVNGSELWRSDGTGTGTLMVANIAAGSVGSIPANFFTAGDSLLFSASDSVIGTELFIIDNPGALPRLLQDINPGMLGSSPTGFVNVDALNRIFFSAGSEISGRELWALPTDGSTGPNSAQLWELYD